MTKYDFYTQIDWKQCGKTQTDSQLLPFQNPDRPMGPSLTRVHFEHGELRITLAFAMEPASRTMAYQSIPTQFARSTQRERNMKNNTFQLS